MSYLTGRELMRLAYKSGYKYQTHRPFIHVVRIKGFYVNTDYIELYKNGTLFIRRGYAWDGSSGPAIDTRSSMRASLVHDVLYQLIRNKFLPADLRDEVDAEYRRLCLVDGMWPWRANLQYKAVRLGGGPAADPKNKKKIYWAPK